LPLAGHPTARLGFGDDPNEDGIGGRSFLAITASRHASVSRQKADVQGTITEADGDVKVKWDGGRTSYFGPYDQANVNSG